MASRKTRGRGRNGPVVRMRLPVVPVGDLRLANTLREMPPHARNATLEAINIQRRKIRRLYASNQNQLNAAMMAEITKALHQEDLFVARVATASLLTTHLLSHAIPSPEKEVRRAFERFIQAPSSTGPFRRNPEMALSQQLKQDPITSLAQKIRSGEGRQVLRKMHAELNRLEIHLENAIRRTSDFSITSGTGARRIELPLCEEYFADSLSLLKLKLSELESRLRRTD